MFVKGESSRNIKVLIKIPVLVAAITDGDAPGVFDNTWWFDLNCSWPFCSFGLQERYLLAFDPGGRTEPFLRAA